MASLDGPVGPPPHMGGGGAGAAQQYVGGSAHPGEPAAANAGPHPPRPPATLLYSARVAASGATQVSRSGAGLSTAHHHPARLGLRPLAWSEGDDLIAAVSSTDGAVSVFHADAPSETSTLLAPNRAPARHIAWQPSAPARAAAQPNLPPPPPLLLVADAANRLTLWASRDRRVNIWEPVATAELPAGILAVGWIRLGGAIVVVLANGNVLARDVGLVGPSPEANRRGYQSTVSFLPCSPQQGSDSIGGPVKCASIAPGGVDLHSVAVLASLAADPTQIRVWHVSLGKTVQANTPRTFETKSLGFAQLNKDDGNCIACLAAPKAGSIYAFTDNGAIGKWVFAKSGSWVRYPPHAGTSSMSAPLSGGPVTSMSPMPPPRPTFNRDSKEAMQARAAARKKRVTAAAVSFDGEILAVADGNRTVAIFAGKDLQPLGRIPTAGSDTTTESQLSPYSGICISPAACCIAGLRVDGTMQNWCLADRQKGLDNEAYARRLVDTTFANGKRGGWDVLAFLSRQGREFTAAVAKCVPALTFEDDRVGTSSRPSPDKIETLRLSVLSAVDGDTAAVAAARRLLLAALEAIRTTAPRFIAQNLLTEPIQPTYQRHFANPDFVLKQMTQAVTAASKTNTLPSLSEMTAAPLADWIIMLCVVWLRRVAGAVARTPSAAALGPVWTAVAEQDGAEIHGERMSIMKDPTLTRTLRNAALGAATLLAADAVVRANGELAEPRHHRLSREDTADVVAAIWDTSRAGETGVTSAIATALSTHERAAEALRNEPKLKIRATERALGIKGSYSGSGFQLAALRAEQIARDPSSRPIAGEEQWCPYDIITGRVLPAWAPLRRCVVSGLLSTEITYLPDGQGAATSPTSPWAERWNYESPFGGLWARVPSLDLERYELMTSAVVPAAATPGQQQRQQTSNQQNVTRSSEYSQTPAINPVPVASHQHYVPPNSDMRHGDNSSASAAMQQTIAQRSNLAAANQPAMSRADFARQQHQQRVQDQLRRGGLHAQSDPTLGYANPAVATAGRGNQRAAIGRAPANPMMASVAAPGSGGVGFGNTAASSLTANNAGMGGLPNSAPNPQSQPFGPAYQGQTMAGLTSAVGGVTNNVMNAARGRGQGFDSAEQNARPAGQPPPQSTMIGMSGAAGTRSPQVPLPKTGQGLGLGRSASGGLGNAPSALANTNSQLPGSMAPPKGRPDHIQQGMGQVGTSNPVPGASINRTSSISDIAQGAGLAAGTGGHVAGLANAAAMGTAPATLLQGTRGGRGGSSRGGRGGGVAGVTRGGIQKRGMHVGGNPTEQGSTTGIEGQDLKATDDSQSMTSTETGRSGKRGGRRRVSRNGPGAGVMTAAAAATGIASTATGNPATGLGPATSSAGGPAGVTAANVHGQDLGGLQSPALATGHAPQPAGPGTGISGAGMLGNQARSNRPGNANASNAPTTMGAPPVGAGMSGSANTLGNSAGPGRNTGMGVETAGAGAGSATGGGHGLTAHGGGASGGGNMNAAVGPSPSGIPRQPNIMGVGQATEMGSSAADRSAQVRPGGQHDQGGTHSRVSASPSGASNTIGETAGSGGGPDTKPTERHVWQGKLQVKGKSNDLIVPCTAIGHTAKDRNPLMEAVGWPDVLCCDASMLKESSVIWPYLNDSTSQWYVRFSPNENQPGSEALTQRLTDLVKVMVERKLAFEIECHADPARPGMLYLWGFNVQAMGYSLLGVYRPLPPPADPPGFSEDLIGDLLSTIG